MGDLFVFLSSVPTNTNMPLGRWESSECRWKLHLRISTVCPKRTSSWGGKPQDVKTRTRLDGEGEGRKWRKWNGEVERPSEVRRKRRPKRVIRGEVLGVRKSDTQTRKCNRTHNCKESARRCKANSRHQIIQHTFRGSRRGQGQCHGKGRQGTQNQGYKTLWLGRQYKTESIPKTRQDTFKQGTTRETRRWRNWDGEVERREEESGNGYARVTRVSTRITTLERRKTCPQSVPFDPARLRYPFSCLFSLHETTYNISVVNSCLLYYSSYTLVCRTKHYTAWEIQVKKTKTTNHWRSMSLIQWFKCSEVRSFQEVLRVPY
jgi:hypothetical protein